MSSNKVMWVDGEGLSVGDTGFLVEISNAMRHSRRFYLHVSYAYRAYDWCGSNNDISTYGRGVWRVTRIAKNGRAQIAQVTDRDALVAFLDEYGFPDLIDECVAAAED